MPSNKLQHCITLSLLTLGLILFNYVAYYLDDFLIAVSTNTSPWLLGTIQVASWPVVLYVELIEKPTLLPIPVVGRAINYCIEIIYFFCLTTPLYIVAVSLHRRVSPKLESYFS